MRMRIDGEDVHVYRQNQAIRYGEFPVAWWNVDGSIVLQLNEHGESGRRPRREVDSHLGLNCFRFPAWLQVKVEHEIGSRVQAPGHVIRLRAQDTGWLPEQEMRIGVKIARSRFRHYVH